MWFSTLIDTYKSNREQKRWAEISKVIPHISTPPLPSFSESSYTVRGLKYRAWLEEFRSWRNRDGAASPKELMRKRGGPKSYMEIMCTERDYARWHTERTKKGKEYAAEDRLWQTFFDEWKKTCLIPALDRINKWKKQESDNRRKRLREEYRRRFGVYPSEESIPERFYPESESWYRGINGYVDIAHCYDNGRRSKHV